MIQHPTPTTTLQAARRAAAWQLRKLLSLELETETFVEIVCNLFEAIFATEENTPFVEIFGLKVYGKTRMQALSIWISSAEALEDAA